MTEIAEKLRLKKFNVFSDPFAKSLLRSDEMRPILAHVLSTITGFSENDILNATFTGGELPKDNLKQKGQIADIIINLDKKRCIIVEINQKNDPALISKNGYYAMKVALSKRTKKIPEPEVWLVSIDRFTLKPAVDIAPQYFEVLENTKGITREFAGYKSVHLPIDYIIAKGYNKDKKLYQFAQIFGATNLEEVYEICKGDDELMSIYDKIKELTGDPMFWVHYNSEEEEEIYRENSKRYAMEQGHKEGRLELISNMLSSGMSKEEISKCTKLSLAEIEKISNSTKIYKKAH